jgi:iron(III) transport system permease protein
MGRWRLALAILLSLLVAVPLASPFAEALFQYLPLHLWAERDRLLLLARNTLLLIGGTLALALPTGVVGAVLLYRTDLPWRRVLRFSTVLTLFIPLPLVASGWQAALGSGGLLPIASWTTPPQTDPDVSPTGIAWKPWAQGFGAAVWVHAVAGLPWVVWLVGRGVSWVEAELEEDALTMMPPWRVLWHVTLRRSVAAIGAAALWVALQTATEVTVTDMMQVRTYGEEVYNEFVRGDRNLVPRLVAVALPSVLMVTLLVVWTCARWQKSLPPLVTITTPSRLFSLGRLRWPCQVAVVAAVAVLAGVPLVSLVWKAGLAGSPEAWSFHGLGDSMYKAIRAQSGLILRSLCIAAMAGVVTALLALATSWLATEARWFREAVLVLMAVAWALPAPIVGIGLKSTIRFLLDAVTLPALAIALYHGPAPLPELWVDLIRFFPFAVAILWPVVRLLPTELRDAARVDGAGPWLELRYVVAPLTTAVTLRAALAVAVLSLGELGAGKLVETPGSETFAHELFSQMHYGTGRDVAALCLLLLAPVLFGGALVALAGHWWSRFGPMGKWGR